MSQQFQTMWANSTIGCSVIVIPDSTHDNSVKKAADGDTLPVGVSTNASRSRPDPDFSQSTQAEQIAAIAGEVVGVHCLGAGPVDLVCNDTWDAGDLIMADSSGYGIACTTGKYYVGFAQGAGTVGALCPINVQPGLMA